MKWCDRLQQKSSVNKIKNPGQNELSEAETK